MSTSEDISPEELEEGIPHQPGTELKTIDVNHPDTGETVTIHIPADHNGSRIRVEFPDGQYAYTEGWDPAERAIAGERPVVPCGSCGTPQTLTSADFQCSACGERNVIQLRTSSEVGEGTSKQSA